jgi:hypothetical protein
LFMCLLLLKISRKLLNLESIIILVVFNGQLFAK